MHYALQCVDAAEPDVHRGGAEVGDSGVIRLFEVNRGGVTAGYGA